jgi:hypothetical protein
MAAAIAEWQAQVSSSWTLQGLVLQSSQEQSTILAAVPRLSQMMH